MPAWIKRKILSIKQKDVAMFVVAKILGHCQGRVTDAKAAARRLIHLTEQHHHVSGGRLLLACPR
jgi:hypothetical protein